MKSSLKIDFADLTGEGIEPIIVATVIDSDDPRDKLVKTFFQSLHNGLIEVEYTNQEHTLTADGLPSLNKRIILKKWTPNDNLKK